MKLIWYNGFPEIYAQLEKGGGSICHRYMYIVLYMKLIWCNGFPDIYAQLEGGPSAKYELTSKFPLYETYLV